MRLMTRRALSIRPYGEDSVPTQFIVKRLMKRIGKVELVTANDGKAAGPYTCPLFTSPCAVFFTDANQHSTLK